MECKTNSVTTDLDYNKKLLKMKGALSRPGGMFNKEFSDR